MARKKSVKTQVSSNITLPVRKMDFTVADKAFREECHAFYKDYEKKAAEREDLRSKKADEEAKFTERVNNIFDTDTIFETLPSEFNDVKGIVEKFAIVKDSEYVTKEDFDYLSQCVDTWKKHDVKLRNIKNPIPKNAGIDGLYDLYKGCSTDMDENRDNYARKVKSYFDNREMVLTSYGWEVLNAVIGFKTVNDAQFLEKGRFFAPIKKDLFAQKVYMFFCEGFVKAGAFPKTKKARHAESTESEAPKRQHVETTEEAHAKSAPKRAEIMESKQTKDEPQSKSVDSMTVAELKTFIKERDNSAKLTKVKKADLVDMAKKLAA